MLKITENLSSVGRRSCEITIEEKTPLSHEVLCFQVLDFGTSEGAVSHNVLYYQPFPITCYQLRFYANNYFKKLPIVSSAFNRSDTTSHK